MPDERELAVLQARQAWWIRVFYLTDPRKPTLADIAQAVGLKRGSASVVSKWITRDAVPKYQHLVRLAAYFNVPLRALTEPDPTDEERATEFRRLAFGAVDAPTRRSA
jgi:transcriptional regulator with XRE-family HTH domain